MPVLSPEASLAQSGKSSPVSFKSPSQAHHLVDHGARRASADLPPLHVQALEHRRDRCHARDARRRAHEHRHMYKPSSADETGATLVTLDDEPTTARPPSDDETSPLE